MSATSNAVERVLRHPRLIKDLAALRALDPNIEDWRLLGPAVIFKIVKDSEEAERRPLLATALFVGTAQAIMQGKYWAPCFTDPAAVEVDCSHLARPISRLHKLEK